MRDVIHFSTYDRRGGAAKSAYQLHKALRAQEVDSQFNVRQKDGADPTVVEYVGKTSFGRRSRNRVQWTLLNRTLEELIRHRPPGFERFSPDISRDVIAPVTDARIVNLHSVAGYVNCNDFLSRQTELCPVVWRLSDMNPLTGGCHYDEGCGRFYHGCCECPQLAEKKGRDIAKEIWDRKLRNLERLSEERLFFVAQSTWMKDCIDASVIAGRFQTEIIPNGVDQEIFQPRSEAAEARTALGIPRDKIVLLFVSDALRNRRKGIAYLAEALAKMKHLKDIFVLLVGEKKPDGGFPCEHHVLGSINSGPLMALVYNLCDIFVAPSTQDNLPNTVLEAMACGKPVLGFDKGGITDLVHDGVTGRLAEHGNVDSLSDCLSKMIDDENTRAKYGLMGRQSVVQSYSFKKQAESHQILYRNILALQG